MKKTVFIELFSGASAPHFLAPNNVVSRLVTDEELRVIFLLPDVKEFKEMAEPYAQEANVEVEYIIKTKPETLLQKAFSFFYSYLIFTGTTKLLATFGARADMPPAGGNRHMAVFKSTIANTFGRSKFIKTKFVPWMYQKLFNQRPYKALFEKHQPDLIFATNLAFTPSIELISEAKRQGVKSLGYPANWDHLNKYYIPIHPDHLIVQNQPMKEEAITYHAYEEKQITVVGFPQFDDFVNPKYIIPKKDFFERMGIPENHKIILHMSGSVYALDEADILEEILGWINKGDFGLATLMIRPYTSPREIQYEQNKYNKFIDKKNIVFNWRSPDDASINKNNYISMFYYADVVISVFSTTAIESAIFDKPAITIGFDGYHKRPKHKSIKRLEKLSHFQHVLDTGSVLVARSFTDLKKYITNYLTNPKQDKDKREELIKKMCYKIDGRSAERVVNKIQELV